MQCQRSEPATPVEVSPLHFWLKWELSHAEPEQQRNANKEKPYAKQTLNKIPEVIISKNWYFPRIFRARNVTIIERNMLRLISITTLLAVVGAADYGLDCSFPIQNHEMSCGDLLGDRQKVYDNFMEGCRRFYGSKAASCDSYENDRIEMSYRQPQSMVVSSCCLIAVIVVVRSVVHSHWSKVLLVPFLQWNDIAKVKRKYG